LTQQLAKKKTVVSPSTGKLLQRLYNDFKKVEGDGASSRKRGINIDTTQKETSTASMILPITPPPPPRFGPYPSYRSLFTGNLTPDRIWEDVPPPPPSSVPKPSRSKVQKDAIQEQEQTQQVEVQEQELQKKGLKAPGKQKGTTPSQPKPEGKKQKGTNPPKPTPQGKKQQQQQQVSEAGAQLNRFNPKAKPFVSRGGG
jgi:hypothetical protein